MEIQDTVHIGHSDDALALLDRLLMVNHLDQEVAEVFRAIKDALERGII